MNETGLSGDTKTGSDIRRKSGFWRWFKWAALAAGGGLVLLLGFVVVVAVPELRREVPPPEISGPDRVVSKPSDLPSSSTSTTRSVDPPTSGTSAILNLDDFPHLSPTMRSLTQAWLDQCAETDRALDRISDPTLRAQAAVLLKNREKIRALLDFPLEWDKFEWREGYEKARGLMGQSYGGWGVFGRLESLSLPSPPPENQIAMNVSVMELFLDSDLSHPPFLTIDRDELALLPVLKGCPEFVILFSKEIPKVRSVMNRMGFELAAHHRKWFQAAMLGSFNNKRSGELNHIMPGDSLFISRDEEAYVLRQLGVRGGVGLVTRSCQDALIQSRMEDRIPRPFYIWTQGVGDLGMFWLIEKPGNKEWDEETALYQEKMTPQDGVTSGSETVKYEDLSTRTTSATLETGN